MRFRIFAMLSLMVSLSIAVESISAQALFGWLPATTSLILDESNTRPDTLGIRFEFDQPVEGTPPQKPPRLITKILSDGSVIGVSEDPLAGTTDKMWNPGDILRVQMTGGSALIHSKVRQFAEEWTKYANIKFVFGDDPTVFPAGVIRIDFNPDGFSWSVVGRDALGVPFNFSTMHFGWFKDDTPDIEIRAVVLHEFGHALGLIHEHQSPSANIQWDKEKVYALFKAMTPPWDKTKVDQNVFEKYRRSSTNFSQFDPTSIMAYAFPASLTLNGQGISGNWELSAIDKQYIAMWYPYPGADQGQLRPGGNCNQINFLVEYGVEETDKVSFVLRARNMVTWWKSIEIPTGANQYSELETYDDVSVAKRVIEKVALDSSRPIRFNQAAFLGIHTGIRPSWDVISALPGGSRVTLDWVKDDCSSDSGGGGTPPGNCPRGQRCCEEEPNGTCLQCVPKDAQCR